MNNETEANRLKQEGNQAYKNKEYQRAINCYTKAIHLHPNDSNFYSNRALSYFNLGQYPQCINDCDKAVQLNPSNVKAYKKKAQALAYQLKFTDAVQCMKAAAACEKDNLALKN